MKRYQIVGLLLMLAFVMAGCGASAANDEHAGMMGMSGMSDHSGMMAAHAIPEEAAAGLNPKPADLHATHVQELSDGALFYVITHGREGTAMVAWENILSEEQRWQVVNFLRTFKP
jgi:hypothetical protein